MKNLPKEIGVIFAGSGALYPVYIGALYALKERGIKVKAIAGTSGGAIAASFWSCFSERYDKEQAISTLQSSLPTKENGALVLASSGFLKKRGLYCSDKLEIHLNRFFTDSFAKALIPLYIFCSKRWSNLPQLFHSERDSDKSFSKILTSSCSIPLIFQSVEMDGEHFYDGGWIYRMPSSVFEDDFPDLPVLAFRFNGSADNKIVAKVVDIIRNFLYRKIFRHLEGFFKEEGVIICELASKYKGSMLGKMNRDDILGMFEEGYNQCLKKLENDELISRRNEKPE